MPHRHQRLKLAVLDQVAIEDLHLALEDLKKVDPDSVEGDVSEEALREEYSRGGLIAFLEA